MRDDLIINETSKFIKPAEPIVHTENHEIDIINKLIPEKDNQKEEGS